MYRRKNPKTGKREGVWYISVRGHRQSSGYSDKEKARDLEHKLNEEARDRANGLAVLKWEEACRDWIEHNPAVAAAYEAKKFIKFWTDQLAGFRLPDITSKVVHKIITDAQWPDGTKRFLVDLINPVSANATANAYTGFVTRVIRAGSNLNPKLAHYPPSKGRDRWLTVEEWGTLSSKMPADLKDLALFALATGLREANVMGLRWEWVKGDWILIPASFTKTERPYAIPLNRTAQGVLQARRGATVRHPELVFVNGGKPWSRMMVFRGMRLSVKAAGIPHFTFHGLRHTFASWLAQKGVSQAIRARLGCWSTGSMADHYSHFDVESLRQYSGLIDDILAAKSSQQSASA